MPPETGRRTAPRSPFDSCRCFVGQEQLLDESAPWMRARSSVVAFMARNRVLITSWVFEEAFALIRATVLVKSPLPMKMSVSSAKKQKISRAMK